MPKRKNKNRTKMKSDWYAMNRVSNESALIRIYGVIHPWVIGADQFAQDLDGLGNIDDLTVAINSPGGSVTEGIAIYNLLVSHSANVTTRIDAAAYSIASVIAMAGDSIQMCENALLMIHDPWTFTEGNADELRKDAEILDIHKDAIVRTYATQTDLSDSDISDLMSDETWFTAESALANGFIDRIITRSTEDDDDESTAGNSSRFDVNTFGFKNVPENLAKSITGVTNMPSQTKVKQELVKDSTSVDNSDASDSENTPSDPANASDISAKLISDEQARKHEIKDGVFAHFQEHADLMVECLMDEKCTPAMASKLLLNKLGQNSTPAQNSPVIHSIADARDKKIEGMTKALLIRSGAEKNDMANEFRTMTTFEIVRECLDMAKINYSRMDRSQMIQSAFTHSTSDFPGLFENTLGKILQTAYDGEPSTWRPWVDVTRVNDFKPNSRVRMGSFNLLKTVPEGGDFESGSFGEERETIQAETQGRLITITRQMIINDDLDAISRLPRMMGSAASRSISRDVYRTLNDNALTSDGSALFSTAHGNLGDPAGPITIALLDLGRQAMVKQVGPTAANGEENDDYVGARPAYLLVGIGQEIAARELIQSATYANGGRNNREINPLQNFVEIISDVRIPGNKWYLVANPNQIPLMEVAFLDGNETPFIDSMEGFKSDGISYKVRLDYGVGANDFRGGFCNLGA